MFVSRRRRLQPSTNRGLERWWFGFWRNCLPFLLSRNVSNTSGRNRSISKWLISPMTTSLFGSRKLQITNVQRSMALGKFLTTTLRWRNGHQTSMKRNL
ncbi:hypothetical protein LINPERHAP1_LOCUS23160 [Linum perenne]